ncbi:MAG: hypothetical protein ABIN95_06650 [Mucilaginibacter sp.]
MLKIISVPVAILFFLMLPSCKSSIKPESLYGKWNYIKVFKPEANPVDSVSRLELSEMKPYIEFSKGNKLQIMWGGELLSHGSFETNGNNIHYTELLEGGQTRKFSFYVSKLTDKEIIFETVGDDGSRVAAVKAE